MSDWSMSDSCYRQPNFGGLRIDLVRQLSELESTLSLINLFWTGFEYLGNFVFPIIPHFQAYC